MFNQRKASPAAQRAAQRRQQENEAPRLAGEVPDLTRLRLSIEERSAGGALSAPGQVRHVVVPSASAVFLFLCGDPRCMEGGHDLTYDVMRALRSRRTEFKGEHECSGTIGSAPCARVMGYSAQAEYSPR